ncbi:MAG: hypothetical protein ACLVEI_10210 [Anaerobutyricum soehngenii]
MNEIVFGGRWRRSQKSTTCSEDISGMKFYLSVLTLQLRWSILFIFCVLAPEEMNEIVFGGERWGRGQKVVVYSDTVSAMLSMMIR